MIHFKIFKHENSIKMKPTATVNDSSTSRIKATFDESFLRIELWCVIPAF